MKKPVYEICLDGNCFFREILVEFDFYGRDSKESISHSIESLHKNYNKKNKQSKILEVSTKGNDLGKKLSAFNLSVPNAKNVKITVESLFQGSKVFEYGGPYQELYFEPSFIAKKDIRLKNSGDIIGFKYFSRFFENEPTTYFYDWLYINSLYLNKELIKEVIKYKTFSDIEFNNNKSKNCQAKSLALFVSLYCRGILEEVIADKELLKVILYLNDK